MKRVSNIAYTVAKKTVNESIWIQNFPEDHQGNEILMQLFIGKDGKPVLTQNNEGVSQYQLNIYGTKAYAYVSVKAMSALKAMGLAKKLENDQVWVKLSLQSVIPSMEEFNRAPAYK